MFKDRQLDSIDGSNIQSKLNEISKSQKSTKNKVDEILSELTSVNESIDEVKILTSTFKLKFLVESIFGADGDN